MTAIEQFYASLPADLVNKPYYAGDWEDMEESDLSIAAKEEYEEKEREYLAMLVAGIRPASFEADYRDF
jgi:hypothetical protein